VLCILILILLMVQPSTAKTNSANLQYSAGALFGLESNVQKWAGLLSIHTDIHSRVKTGGEFVYWFVSHSPDITEISYEISSSSHFILYPDSESNLQIYINGLMGFHRRRLSYKMDDEIKRQINFTPTIGAGIGAQVVVRNISFFVEPRYFIAGFDQLTVAFGKRFRL